jgi:hypothetical protein
MMTIDHLNKLFSRIYRFHLVDSDAVLEDGTAWHRDAMQDILAMAVCVCVVPTIFYYDVFLEMHL